MTRPTRSSGSLSARRNLVTDAWTGTVNTLQAAVTRFKSDRDLRNECQVVFFEVGRDGPLHVNVTHRYLTSKARGWAGPGSVPAGFVHNRTFGEAEPGQMVRHIREMVYAPRV